MVHVLTAADDIQMIRATQGGQSSQSKRAVNNLKFSPGFKLLPQCADIFGRDGKGNSGERG